MNKRKKLYSVWSTAFFLLVVVTNLFPARASLRQEQPLAEQAVHKVLGSTEKVIKQSRFNFDAGVCFGVAVINRGDKIQTPYSLERGVRYLFIGGGDRNAQDINLAVLDSRGRAVAQDIAPDAIPVVFFTPKYTGSYQLALRLKQGRSTLSFCSMVVMRKTGGYALPVSSIRNAIQPSEKLSPEMNQLAERLRFHRVRNQWTAFGAVLKQGDATRVPGLKYETGSHVFIGGSDGRSTDLDIFLLNSAGQKIAESNQSGATPALVHQTSANQSYQLMIANRRSRGASLVFLIALDVKTAGMGAGRPSGSRAPTSNVRGGITVLLNGERVEFETVGAVEINGRVMVPLQELFEAMGADVEFDDEDNTYHISAEDDEIVLKMGSPLIAVNGRTFRMETAPVMYSGTAMVPLRFFIQAAGAQVNWNGQQRVVSITVPE